MAGLFGGGRKAPQAQEQPAVGALNVSTSAYGLVRPLVWGRARLPVNMLWYGDFASHAHSIGGGQSGGKGGEGGGGGGGTSYTYSASFAEAVCEGPITGIGKVWEAKNETTVAAMGGTVMLGEDGQEPWTYLSSNHPSEAFSYSGLAYLGLPNFQLGDSPSTPNLSVEALTPSEFSEDIVDALPSMVVGEFLEKSAFPTSKVGNLSTYGMYCQAQGIFISPALTEQQAANTTLQEWATSTNSEFVWSSGVLSLAPYGDTEITGNGVTYTPDMTPVYDLTDDDFVCADNEEPIICTRPDMADAYNQFKIEYQDRSNAYNVAVATVGDQSHIDIYGLRPASVIKAHHIKDAETAELVVRLIMARSLYVRAQYEFKLTWKHCRLDAMDLVALTDSGLGLVRELVRIVEIEEDEEGCLTVKAEEVPGAIAAPARYVTQGTNPYVANFNAAPGNANAPVIFEPPSVITDTGLEVWIAASGGPVWGGADVWISQDGDNYARVGSITNPSRQGVLTTSLPVGDVIDSVHALAVDMSMSRGVLNSGSPADAIALNSLCYADGELLAYTTATLTGPSAYSLTGLVRGAYGTAISTHSVGAQFARLDGAVFKYPFLADKIGKTIYVKLLSFNVWGSSTQSLADVDAIVYPVTGVGFSSVPPTGIATSETVYTTGEGTALFSSLSVSWTASTDIFAKTYVTEYSPAGANAWTPGASAEAPLTNVVIRALRAGNYDIRVKTLTSFGAASDWEVLSGATVLGVSLLPTLSAPQITGISEAQIVVNNGQGVNSEATVSFSEPSNPEWEAIGVTPYYYQVEVSDVGANEWSVFDTPDYSPGVSTGSVGRFDWRVKAITSMGLETPYSDTFTFELRGLTDPPADISGFSAQSVNGLCYVQWNAPTDLDVKIGGYVQVRYSSLTSGATWNDGTNIGPQFPGTATHGLLPLLTGTYLAKAVDSSGNYSVNAASMTVTAPVTQRFSGALTVQESPAFAGGKSGCIVVDGGLQLDGAALIDSFGLIDDVGLMDSAGGVTSSGTYTFGTPYVDLGGVYTVRLVSSMTATGFDTGDTIDSRTGLIDSWATIDGDVVNSVNAQLYVSTTNDDPAGAPTWSAWSPFYIGDYSARGIKHLLVMTSALPTNNIRVSSLSVDVNVPHVTLDVGHGLSIPSGGQAFTYASVTGGHAFYSAPTINVTPHNMATGDYYLISSASRTGFAIQFFNSSGVGVARTADISVSGFGQQTA